MFLLRTLLITFLFAANIIAQSAWEIMNPLPQEKTVNAVQILNDSLIYAAGENGAFLRSYDYGVTWQRNPLSTEVSLMSVYFEDELHGWLGARGGKLYKTTDGGYNFAVAKEFPGRDIIKINITGGAGYICTREGELISTTDGFNSASAHQISAAEIITGIEILPAGPGLATGESGGIYSTTDSGNSWVKLAFSAGVPLKGVKYIDNEKIIIYGHNGYAANSADGGSNWSSSVIGSSNIAAVDISVNGQIFAANVTGAIYKSNDSGASWQECFSGSEVSYRAMKCSRNFVFAAGEYGVMSASINSGTDWLYRSTGSRVRFNKIKFLDSGYGWIIGDRGLLLHTTDGGISWYRQYPGTDKDLYDLSLNKDLSGNIMMWMVGARGTHLISSDTGKTFRRGPLDTMTTFNLRAISMTKNVSRIVGDGATIYESPSSWGAGSWKRKGSLPSSINFTGYSGISTRSGYIVGNAGSIYIILYRPFGISAGTNFGDSTWSQPYDFKSIFFIDALYGWIVGEHGIVLGTTNGGKFNNIANLNAGVLNSVHFLNRSLGITAGSNGKIFKTTDGGINWREQYTGVTAALNSVFIVDENRIIAVGAGGTLLKSETAGELPSFVRTEDNNNVKPGISIFPHPVLAANPHSAVRFTLKTPSAYRLELFNAAGSSVAVLEDGEAQEGDKTFYFSPEKYELSSGIYLISLTTPYQRTHTKLIYLK